MSSIASLADGRPSAADATPTSTRAKSGPATSRIVDSDACLPLILHTDLTRPPPPEPPPPPPPMSVRSSRSSPPRGEEEAAAAASPEESSSSPPPPLLLPPLVGWRRSRIAGSMPNRRRLAETAVRWGSCNLATWSGEGRGGIRRVFFSAGKGRI